MGYDRHHAIIVTGFDTSGQGHDPELIRQKAIELFGPKMVSEIVVSPMNFWSSFFVAPDGSKEGWDESNKGDTARTEFIRYLRTEHKDWCDWVEVQYGDDERETLIVRHSDQGGYA